jgi:AcrR family transcriptional regulator
MDEKAATRDRILDAAMTRIKHYGYGKTTMAEIASDCSMSPGNIYRFFEAKIDIAEAMARKHYAEQHAVLSQIARKSEKPADERLREILFRKMRDNYKLVENHAKILEVAAVLSTERALFFNELMAMERVILAALITEGVAAGLFEANDSDFAAEMLQATTAKFAFPHLFSQLTLPKLERELEGVLDFFFRGLYARPASPN